MLDDPPSLLLNLLAFFLISLSLSSLIVEPFLELVNLVLNLCHLSLTVVKLLLFYYPVAFQLFKVNLDLLVVAIAKVLQLGV